eukprot:TRINITY_DN1214_c0_g1_i3.p1 TRINITY_DN1214_c0_g1~~TRINITY_DN1214_c0_g1_i3.p1  ORF type:complete len:182 (-),score=24.98 TRINITY_DN1214_c0_g1_i3:60-605(-)
MKSLLPLLVLVSLCYCTPTLPPSWQANVTLDTSGETNNAYVYTSGNESLTIQGDQYDLTLNSAYYVTYFSNNKSCVVNCWNGTVPNDPDAGDCTSSESVSTLLIILSMTTNSGDCNYNGISGQLWTFSEDSYDFSFCFQNDNETPIFFEINIDGGSMNIYFSDFVPKVDPSTFDVPSYCNV